MTNEQDKKGLADVLSDNAERILVGVLALALLSALIVGFAYFALFLGPPLSIEPATLGQAGDYFGGILNPIFGFLSVFALLVALVLQTRELKLSRESLKISQEELKASREEQAKAAEALAAQNAAIRRQSFEQTFFSWLASYESRLNDIEIIADHDTGALRRGRRALYDWWNNRLSPDAVYWSKEIRDNVDSVLLQSTAKEMRQFGGTAHMLERLPSNVRGIAAEAAMVFWRKLYSDWEYLLDSLFRDLYRLLLWIDSQDERSLTTAQKWLYVSIVRAKLSWIELVYLFYNAQTSRGAKFKVLIERYALFDNLTMDADCVLAFVKAQPGDGAGYANTAYCSITARRALGLPDTAEDALSAASKG